MLKFLAWSWKCTQLPNCSWIPMGCLYLILITIGSEPWQRFTTPLWGQEAVSPIWHRGTHLTQGDPRHREINWCAQSQIKNLWLSQELNPVPLKPIPVPYPPDHPSHWPHNYYIWFLQILKLNAGKMPLKYLCKICTFCYLMYIRLWPTPWK